MRAASGGRDHTLVLKSSQGSVTRKVVVKPNETTMLSEAIGAAKVLTRTPVRSIDITEPVIEAYNAKRKAGNTKR